MFYDEGLMGLSANDAQPVQAQSTASQVQQYSDLGLNLTQRLKDMFDPPKGGMVGPVQRNNGMFMVAGIALAALAVVMLAKRR